MTKIRISILVAFFFIVLSSGTASAQERKLLYSKAISPRLQEVTTIIRNLNSQIKPHDQQTQKPEFFVRIAPREYILDGNDNLKSDAILGTKPYVFITTAEGVYGLSLLDIYLSIGYEAEDIMSSERDKDMVMIVFRYPPEIVLSDTTNGQLPSDWNKKVYVSTWENIFSLFSRLTALDSGNRSKSQADSYFIQGFPEEGKQRIKSISYAGLKSSGGADWKYRSLLEKQLSVFEHFRGNGQTQNEVRDPDATEPGLYEFVGPKSNIKDLPEVAIIHLGKLNMNDSYGGGCKLCARANQTGSSVGTTAQNTSQPPIEPDPNGGASMIVSTITEILGIIVWPMVALAALFILRPHLAALMSNSKVNLSMFGKSIETTLPKLKKVIEEQTDDELTDDQIKYLKRLFQQGASQAPREINDEDRRLLRSIWNSGLITAQSNDTSPDEATEVKLSALGRLYVRELRDKT